MERRRWEASWLSGSFVLLSGIGKGRWVFSETEWFRISISSISHIRRFSSITGG